jgi:hypothetical protein
LSKPVFRSICPLLFAAQAAVSGPNAGVDIGVVALSPPCQLKAGDSVDFLVTARHTQDVRQVKLDLAWQPQSAIDSVRVELPESALSAGLIAPFPAEVGPGVAALGLATFGDGANGDLDLVRFSLLLAPHVTAETRIEVWIEEISMGPSFTERDSLNPAAARLFANHCDDRHQVLEHALLLNPDVQHLPYSSPQRSSSLDQSAGEAEVLVRLFEDGALVPETTMRWDVVNSGAGTVNILEGISNAPVAPGFARRHTTTTDDRGRSALAFDVGTPSSGEPTTAEITVCASSPRGERCAVGRIEWATRVTTVSGADAVELNVIQLEQSYPNPFNGQTQIRFFLADDDRVSLSIFNVAGQRIGRLIDASLVAGSHQISWDGRDRQGMEMASGRYFAVLRVGDAFLSEALTLLR